MIITYTVLKDGVPTDVLGVNLSNEAADAAIVRVSDSAVVLAPSPAMTSTGVAGRYSYNFASGTEGVSYAVNFKITAIEGTFYDSKIVNATIATSPFHTYDEFVARWGEKNVRIASNKDSSTTAANYTAIQGSFDYAVSEIYRAFRGGLYEVPLNFQPNDGIVPATVKRWAMVIAYADLYDARGQDERDKVWNKISIQLRATYADMAMHAAGLRQLPATSSGNGAAPMEGSTVSYVGVLQAAPGFRYLDGVPVWR